MTFFKCFQLSFLMIFISPCAVADQRLPNIVLLVGDDHGYPYFGFMGDEHVVTPTMDALAAGGFVYTQGHVTAPYCRPSLRTIITGLHPVQYAHQKNAIVQRRMAEEGFDGLGKTEQAQWKAVAEADAMSEIHALPRRLQELGYASWEGGKWWERTYRNAGFTEGMTDGWDMSQWGTEGWFYQLWGSEG
jgi:arylsulfatase A-like enzyme